ncbi:MAG: ATP-binding cassette domain-containing protein [Phycisphaeraceae bacterium]|nr:ATP-binding cassette domain-containing protein [Phycisphaeraceae bacterium]
MLQIQKLDKTFNRDTMNSVHALNQVDLTIEDSSFVVVVGTNGSGKSTLLNAVAGTFLSDTGRIKLADTDITKWPEHKRARFIGRVFQDPFKGTAPGMTIAENLALASKRGQSRGLAQALNRSVTEDFKGRLASLNMGLEDRLNNPIGSLSGGQRQAITLLMATWLKTDLLLLDEHTAALDPRAADQIIRLTTEIVSQKKLTTMMVTHSMNQAVSQGDRLIMMHKGEIIHDLSGAEKSRLRPDDLLVRFDDIRRSEQLDRCAARLLEANYV